MRYKRRVGRRDRQPGPPAHPAGGDHLVGDPADHRARHVRLGDADLLRRRAGRRPTPSSTSSPPSSGCGRSSIPEGPREINTLHLPVGQPVKLTMTSQDVIHSFYVPAFRVKQDVLPGRYTTIWFEPTEVGTYHLFCAEYCGAEHSLMGGSVVVMAPQDYEAWLAGSLGGSSLLASGADLFQRLSCDTCHREAAGAAVAGAVAGRPLRPPGGAGGRRLAGRRRELPARVDRRPAGEGGRRLAADHAHLQGAGERGAAQRAGRLHPLAQAGRRARDRLARRQFPTRGRGEHEHQRSEPPAAELPERRLQPQVVAAHPRPQADRHPLHGVDHALLRPRRDLRAARPAGAAHPQGRPAGARHLQPHVHHARHHHGLLLPDPVGAGGAGQLPGADHDRGQGPRLPAHQPGELVPLHDRRHHHPLRHPDGRGGHRLDLLHALLHHLLEQLRGADHRRHLHRRLLVDLHRPELHRHHPPHAGAGPDLVPAAAVHLVALRHQPGDRARHPGGGHHPGPGGGGAHPPAGDLRPGAGRRPDPLPAPVLVLLAPGGLHHDPAGDGGGQRADRRLRPQEGLRLPLRRLRLDRHRRPRLPGLGPPHVRHRPVDLRGDGLLGLVDAGGHPLGGQGLQLDGDPLPGVDLARRRRCSTRWGSSASSPSAG